MSIFAEYKVTAGCMFACIMLSIFVRVFLGALYSHMIKETLLSLIKYMIRLYQDQT